MKKNKAINLSNGYKDEHPILFFDNGRGPGTASPNTKLHIDPDADIYNICKIAMLEKQLEEARKVIESLLMHIDTKTSWALQSDKNAADWLASHPKEPK
jgi:hypothetical protein